MKWCEHCNDEFCRWGTWVTHLSNVWKFCPICGTPRPKEKTLEEKFKQWSKRIIGESNYPEMAKDLANIAEEHFKAKT